MAEAVSSANSDTDDTTKSDPLVLLLSGAAAVLWSLVVYGLLVRVPEYQMGFIGREEFVPATARWLVAMSEPWIVLLFTIGIFALILGSFYYRNKALGLVMVILGAASVYGALTTLEEAKELAANSVDSAPRRATLNPDLLENKVNGAPTPTPAPAPTQAPAKTPPLSAPPPSTDKPAEAPPVKPAPTSQEKAPAPPPSLARPK